MPRLPRATIRARKYQSDAAKSDRRSARREFAADARERHRSYREAPENEKTEVGLNNLEANSTYLKNAFGFTGSDFAKFSSFVDTQFTADNGAPVLSYIDVNNRGLQSFIRRMDSRLKQGRTLTSILSEFETQIQKYYAEVGIATDSPVNMLNLIKLSYQKGILRGGSKKGQVARYISSPRKRQRGLRDAA